MPTLSDSTVQTLLPSARPYRMSFGEGLYVEVRPNGSKLWRLAYRFGGRQKTYAIGVYPAVTAKKAAKEAERARRLLGLGIDPSAAKVAAKAASKVETGGAETFESVARRWYKGRSEHLDANYAERLWHRIKTDILPTLGKQPIDQIEPPLALSVVRKVEERGALTMARRCKSYIGEIVRFAIAEGKATRDPTQDIKDALRKPAPVRNRRPMKVSEMPNFFHRVEKDGSDDLTKLAVLLTMYTFLRTHEIRFARWSEFEGLETAEALWRIPPERMKRGKEHLVPLAASVVGIVSNIRALGLPGPHLFPERTKTGVISENRMLYFLYRVGFHSKATIHGLRGTASTVLHESGLWDSDWIEAQLSHTDSTVRGVYNSAEYLPHRRRMMQWYADFLDRQRALGALQGLL